jgi:hypothetical protein
MDAMATGKRWTVGTCRTEGARIWHIMADGLIVSARVGNIVRQHPQMKAWIDRQIENAPPQDLLLDVTFVKTALAHPHSTRLLPL